MKTLVLCRHAKSDWPQGIQDIHRPLKKRGIQDAHFLGELLAKRGFLPNTIISSPAVRAHSTAQIIANQVSFPEERIQLEDSVYYESSGALLTLIQELPRSQDTVMIFGHNPTMENTVRYILQMQAAFEMPTSAMVCLESYISNWGQFDTRNAHLRWMLIPRFKRKDTL